jgi:hypothetical protein
MPKRSRKSTPFYGGLFHVLCRFVDYRFLEHLSQLVRIASLPGSGPQPHSDCGASS